MSLTKIGSIGINTGIQFAGVTTIATLNASDNVLSVGGTVNFNSDVSIGGSVSIGGTLTYEDVTNVDSVGLITARNGIVVGSGITLSKDGDIFATGVTTTGSLVSSGAISGTTGTFSAAVSGTTGTFTGDVDIADTIVHTGDTNTKIRFPAADTITAETSGTERFRISSTGRVSLGDNPTVSSDNILHIEDSGETNVKIEGSTSTLGARISLQNNDTTANAYNQYAFHDAGGQSTSAIQGINTDQTNNYGELAFLTRNAQGSPPEERVRITKDGNIGIGVETPSAKLDVRLGGTGTIAEFRGADTDLLHIDGDSNQITLDARNVGALGFEMQGSTAMTIDSSSRLLVGTTTSDTGLLLLDKNLTAESDASDTANYHLVIRSQSNSNTSKVGIAFKNTSDATTVGAAILHHRTAGGSVGDLGFYTSPSDGTTTERLLIASNGTVKFKTGVLELGSTSGQDNYIYSTNAAGIIYQADENGHRFQTYSGSWKDRLTITDAGVVTIGANDNDPAQLELKYSTVPTYLTSTFDGTVGEATLSVNVPRTSDGSGSWGSHNNTGYGSAAIQALSHSSEGGYVSILTGSADNTNPTEKMRIRGNGSFGVGTNNESTYNDNDTASSGLTMNGGSKYTSIARYQGTPLLVNRMSQDGNLLGFYESGANVGSISVSGNTVSYNPFLGCHKGRLSDGSKPTILLGTIVETISQSIEWKTATISNVGSASSTVVIPYYGTKTSGTDTVSYGGASYTGIVGFSSNYQPKGNNKHVCVKVSDTVSSKAVGGVFVGWDSDVNDAKDNHLDEPYNDLRVGGVGNFFIRIKSGETIAIGDLVESNGDGTGKVQSDDIIRSKTVGKITSTNVIKTYDDGSFLVTAVLYAG